jgi:hypothetical protein
MNRWVVWILVFASAAAFFGWEAYRAWTGPLLPGTETPAAEAFSLPAAAPPQAGPGDALYPGLSSIVARPVFRPDRRPYQEVSAGVPQKNYEAELSKFTVLGVLMVGDEKKAIVVSKGSGATDRWEVKAGDSLADFTVKEVGLDGLVLAADGREFTLPLYADGPKSVGGGPLRTEVTPAPPPAQAQPSTAARPAPAAGRFPPPAAVAPSPATSPQPSGVSPSPVPQMTYPRRYIPGRR